MQEHSISECSSITATGNYSCIKLDIAFEREFGYNQIIYYNNNIIILYGYKIFYFT